MMSLSLSRVNSDDSSVSTTSSSGSWTSEFPVLKLESGDYHLLKRLGAGTSSVVYEGLRAGSAKRTKLAIKVARSLKTDFRKEAALQNAVADHTKSVMPVLEDRLSDGRSVLVMPSAQTLDGCAGKLSETMLKWLIQDIGGALVASHHLRIAHGDVKPEQILALRRQPGQRQRFVIGDFGFASTSRITEVRGSPAFMNEATYAVFQRWRDDSDFWEMFATEEERFDPQTGISIDLAACDVYAFAFTLLVLIVGDHVADFPTEESLLAWHRTLRSNLEPTLASFGLSHDACEVLAAALSPNAPFCSMRQFVDAAVKVERWSR